MRIALDALSALLSRPISKDEAVKVLPMLGFPIDGAEDKDGTTVLDLDITANRGDMMSHWGVARELAAKLELSLTPLPPPRPEGQALRDVRLETAQCPLYATALLTLGASRGTPEPDARFLGLLDAGVKQLPAVDASNALLHRYGHPTHAFDADKLRGVVSARLAVPGEMLTTLDGVARTLTAGDLIIADENGPVALAGVMGGEATKVTPSTTRVLLESAFFDPRTVRLTARRHGLHTDASHRFGRGADPAMAPIARDLFVQALQTWAGATLESAWTIGSMPKPAPAVHLPWPLLDRCAGEALDQAEAALLLQRMGCRVAAGPGGLAVVPPSWRHDLAIAEDLAEEVLRLRGYDRLPAALPHVDAIPEPLEDGFLQRQALAQRLAHLGFHQAVTYGFISPAEDAPFADAPAEDRTLSNPLGVEYSVLRSSLLPSLRAAGEMNVRQGAKEVRIFEIAPSYHAGLQARLDLAILWGGLRGGEDPHTPGRAVKADDLRGVAVDLGAPSVEVKMLGEGLFAFEIPLAALPLPESRIIPTYRAFSRYPAVERDLSLLVDLSQRHADLAAALKAALPPELQSAGCVDVFRHKSLPPGKQAWLMRLRFQADRTLTGEEVDTWMNAALAAAETCGAQLRS